MLCEYSGAKRSSIFGVCGGGAWSRFWAGRWSTNHGNEVYQALSVLDRLPPAQQSMATLISELTTRLGNKMVKKDGDLSRILNVIGERTGIKIDIYEDQSNIKQKF